ncbi:unnamed protein product [Heligmosomoides polygyrus]|uniref:Uncharacterized protein n=1 Tax=Heligmosomoides polygyrus TaxID=6339 RepID=A0A183FMU2_HELPZ|nr:unnamed protein product [Heligmosomoides polygyrus]
MLIAVVTYSDDGRDGCAPRRGEGGGGGGGGTCGDDATVGGGWWVELVAWNPSRLCPDPGTEPIELSATNGCVCVTR